MITRIKQLMATAIPIAIGQIGQMGMILIDMYIVGKLGAAAIGGVGLGNGYFYVFGLFSAGMLFALDYYIATAQGRGDQAECNKWLWQGCWLSLFLSIGIIGVVLATIPAYLRANFKAEIAEPAAQFVVPLALCMPGFTVFITFRQYLQSTGSVTAGTVVTILAIGFNYLFNWMFVFGELGAPKMGVAGSGLATTLTRTLQAVALVGYAFYRDGQRGLGLASSPKGLQPGALWDLTKMGIPIGIMVALESGVFTVATSLIARFGVEASAAHTIVLNVASFTYTIPTAIAGAAAVLVGQALGRGDLPEVRRVGWTAIGAGAVVMACTGAAIGVFGAPIAGMFTTEAPVIALCAKLIVMVAVFQIADGVQSVGGGVLRGAGDTKSAMIANLIGYWLVGLPAAYYFGITQNQGVTGFWLGLTIGLFAVAGMVLTRCVLKSRALKGKLADA